MLSGVCLCGTIRYETDARPFHETICHCADCGRAVGAMSVAWFSVPREAFRVLSGTPSAFRSSAKVTRRFCGTCGTSLTFEHDDLPEELDVTIASLDDPGSVPPRDHIHAAAKTGWVDIRDGLPIHPGSRT